jgi:hypothetical protein
MNLSREMTLELLNLVWLPLLDTRLHSYTPVDDEMCHLTFRTACVSIIGPEKFAVFIDSSNTLAAKIAAAMFCTTTDQLDENEISDALGEFVNMVAGEIEENLIGSYQIGIPVISDSRCHKLKIPHTHILTDCWAADNGDPMRALILTMNPG